MARDRTSRRPRGPATRAEPKRDFLSIRPLPVRRARPETPQAWSVLQPSPPSPRRSAATSRHVFAASPLLDSARERRAGLVVLPECALGGYLREPHPGAPGLDLPPALRRDGPELARLARMAGDLVVCAGYTERGDTGVHSSAVCVSGDGILGHQRKVHLPPAERFAYVAGDGFEAFDTPAGRLGMLLCYDKLFPEAARVLACDGAEVICSLAAWPVDRHAPARRVSEDRQTRHFDAVDVARAIESQVVWASANQTGRWGRLRFLGGAKVVSPDGELLARTGARAGVALAQVDVAGERARVRTAIDHLADRRPDAYGGPGSGSEHAFRNGSQTESSPKHERQVCAASSPSTERVTRPSSSRCSSGSRTADRTTAGR
jgi:N-carbamoylputrescine amidase